LVVFVVSSLVVFVVSSLVVFVVSSLVAFAASSLVVFVVSSLVVFVVSSLVPSLPSPPESSVSGEALWVSPGTNTAKGLNPVVTALSLTVWAVFLPTLVLSISHPLSVL
jgi:hypothetical protein